MLEAIGRYGEVLPNLRLHDPDYPSVEFLKERVMLGDETEEHLFNPPPHGDTPGSELIVQTLLDDDPRPVFVPSWGGANTTAQALWKLKQQYPPAEFQRATAKIRIYCISFQDAGGQWIVENIPEAQIVEAGSWYQTWFYHPQEHQPHTEYMSAEWLARNVKTGHGPLGASYPQDVVSEGDTPSFLDLINNGLRSWQDFGYGGWGGRFERVKGNYWKDSPDNGDTHHALTRWTIPTQNDFAARMDWCVKPFDEANHPPVVALSGDLDRQAAPGERLHLDAAATADPDGDSLTLQWWQYREAGTYPGVVDLGQSEGAEVQLSIPADARPGETIHLICEASDQGSPPLTGYQRLIITVQ
jgi:hypothetical protein